MNTEHLKTKKTVEEFMTEAGALAGDKMPDGYKSCGYKNCLEEQCKGNCTFPEPIDPMKETEQTLLDQIKDQVVTDYGYRDWKHFHRGNTRSYDMRFNEIVDNIANRYAEAKAKASCEATLKKAAENVKVIFKLDASLKFAERNSIEVDESSITDPNSITIV